VTTTKEGRRYLEENGRRGEVTTLPSGLQYQVLESGPESGLSPNASSSCDVHYRGSLINGFEFDASYNRGDKPSTFRVGGVIRGWQEALQLMREGDRWMLYVPSELAYGDKKRGKIPPGSVLIFEMTLLRVSGSDSDRVDPMVTIGIAVAFGALCIWKFIYDRGPTIHEPVVSVKEASNPKNPRVYFELIVGTRPIGRIEFELFSNIVPKTAENFRALCTGEKTGQSGVQLHYKHTPFHRIIPGCMAHGGDVITKDGMSSESIYGECFDDEWANGTIKHTQKGLLTMYNQGRNSNGSQFFLTFSRADILDGRNVVFGKVDKGMDVLKLLETLGSPEGKPRIDVVISDCGSVDAPKTR